MAKSRGRKLADIIVTSGADIAGTLSFDGGSTSADLSFADSDKATFGDSLDLQIYHDSSASYIKENGSGDLIIQGSNTMRLQGSSSQELANFSTGGAVNLYHNNVEKLRTTAAGIFIPGTIQTQDGSASAPAYSFASDNNTGMYRGGTDTLAFTTAGSERMRLTSTGLGINTTTPARRLEINHHGSTIGMRLTRGDNAGNSLIEFANTGGVKNIIGHDAGRSGFVIGPSTTPSVTIKNSTGNVGIGTDAPDAKLHITSSADNILTVQNTTYQGSGQNTEAAIRFKVTASSDDERAKAGILFKNDGSAFGRGDLHFLVDSNDDNGNAVLADSKMIISHEGRVGIGTTSPTSIFHILGSSAKTRIQDSSNNYALDLQMSSSVGLISTSADMALRPGGVESVRLKSDGKVGIGTVSPTDELTIRGAQFNTTQISIGDNTDRLRLGYIHADSLVSSTAAGQIVTTASTELKIAPASNAASKIMFFTNASSGAPVERMRITSGGDVIIGATSAVDGAHFQHFQSSVRHQSFQSSNGDLAIVTDNNTNPAVYVKGTGTADLVNIFDNTTEVFTILDGGNVGIGTASPQDTLHVVTDSSTTNDTVDVVRIEATSSGTPAVGFGPVIDFRGERGGASSDHMGKVGFVADIMTASRIDGAFIVETAIDGSPTERLRITSTGNVGIGTASPTSKVDIRGAHGATHSRGQLYLSNTESHAVNQGSQISLGGTYAGTADTYFGSIAARKENATSGNYAGYLQFGTRGDGTSNAERMRITSTGNVGIGTSSPANLLHLRGGAATLEIDSSTNTANLDFDNNSTTGRISLANDDLSIQVGGSQIMRIHPGGNVCIGTGNATTAKLVVKGADSSDVLHLHGLTGTNTRGLKISLSGEGATNQVVNYDSMQANGIHVFKTAGAERMRIHDGGNVGIGTASPDSKLTVNVNSNSDGIELQSNQTKIATLFRTSVGGQVLTSLDGVASRPIHVGGIVNEDVILVNAGGNVGIGETIPTEKLHVGGNIKMQATTAIVTYQNAANTWNVGLDAADASFKFKDGTAERIRIDSSGNVGIGTSNPDNLLHVYKGGSGHTWNFDGGDVLILENSDSLSINITTPAGNGGNILFSDANARGQGRIIYDHSGDYMAFMAGGISNECMRIDSARDWMVGNTVSRVASFYNNQAGCGWREADHHFEIATTNNRSALEVGRNNANSGDVITIRQQGTSVGMIGTEGGDSLVIQSNGSTGSGLRFHPSDSSILPVRQGATIDSTINLGSATRRFKDLHLSGVAYASQIQATNNSGSNGTTTAQYAVIGMATGSAQATIGAHHSGDSYANLNLSSVVGGDRKMWHISKRPNSLSNRLEFFWYESGGFASRFIFSKDGDFTPSSSILIGTSTKSGKITIQTNNNTGLHIRQTSTSVNQIPAIIRTDYITGGQTGKLIRFEKGNGAEIGSVTGTISALSYNTTSDQRLKDNIVDAPSASDDIDAIQVRSFDWKADGSHQKYGMVAQELQNVAPGAVTAPENPEEMMGVDYSKLVPMLVKEIQSLRARVAELEGE